MPNQALIFSIPSPAARLISAQPVAVMAAILACASAAFTSLPDGILARHMFLHVLMMNAVAPLAALLLVRLLAKPFSIGGRWLALATFLQIAILWGWHAPAVLAAALAVVALHVIMQLSLFVIATIFWFAIILQRDTGLWRAIFALLITSKLYCLLGALLIFAPTALYSGADLSHGHELGNLGDQHTAGLLMLLACPATYVLVGLIITARWLGKLGTTTGCDWVATAKSLASRQSS